MRCGVAHCRPISWVLALGAGMLLAFAGTGWASAQAAWLDASPQPWNRGGAAVPAAPRDVVIPLNIERCQGRERQPQTPEEQRVVEAGWRLTDYWPLQRQGDVVALLALAGYDGMCRPWGYNGFVFVRGRFAGTVAPLPMNSRTDGALDHGPTLLPDGRLEAIFRRYAPTDPYCCPSRPSSRVGYRIAGASDSPTVVPEEITSVSPAQLPRAGEVAPSAIAGVAGIAMLAVGFLLRRRAWRESRGR